VRLLLGEMATVVLDGQRVVPRKAEGLGFKFRFTEVETALRDVTRD
jgi:NAD dependent epimerase/dehydratase family enzyme